MYDITIIGAGPGGSEAGIYSASKGYKTLIIEKGLPGGVCLHKGCIPTKSLLKSSKMLSDIRNSAVYGINSGETNFSVDDMMKRKDTVISALLKGLNSRIAKSGAELLQGEAEIISPAEISVNGKKIETKNILIASGSSPAVPPIAGIEHDYVADSSDMLSLNKIPDDLIIIGAGVIGMEFAFLFSELGSNITILEAAPTILPFMDSSITKRLTSECRKKKIKIETGARVEKIEDGIKIIFTDKKGTQKTSEASRIMYAAGRRPTVNGLGLENAGVKYSSEGIKTDNRCITNVRNIAACGDAAGKVLLAHSASREGIAAVNNLFGTEDIINYDTIPSVIYTHPEAASVGMTDREAEEKGIEFEDVKIPMGFSGRFIIENKSPAGELRALFTPDRSKLLGVHITGNPAGELIGAAALMIDSGMPPEQLSKTVFPHPTVSEILHHMLEM
ncbi:MAG: dihydrolipoyl dehydrogenase [Fibrobacterota bacterium]